MKGMKERSAETPKPSMSVIVGLASFLVPLVVRKLKNIMENIILAKTFLEEGTH